MYERWYESEEALWQEARDRLHGIYGETSPLTALSRLETEEMLARGTGYIRFLKLQAGLREAGIDSSWDAFPSATLTGWLMNTSIINPLPPHTVCPKCHRAVFHPEVKDGWDLPESRCTCGTTLVRDGHDIPIDCFENRFTRQNRAFTLCVESSEEETLWRLVSEQYDERWETIQFQPPHGEGTIWSLLRQNERCYAIIPKGTNIPFPTEEGIYQLPDDRFRYDLVQIPEVVVCIEIHCPREQGPADQEPEEQALTEVPLDIPTDELLKPEILEKLRDQMERISGLVITASDDGTSFHAAKYYHPQMFPGHGIVKEYPEENISAYLPERITFSTIIQHLGIGMGIGWQWHGFAGEVVKAGEASYAEIPVTWEDLLQRIAEKLQEHGIRDKGIALRIMHDIRHGQLSNDTLNAIDALEFDDWFGRYLKFLSPGDLEGKALLITEAYELLYRIKNKELKGIDKASTFFTVRKINPKSSI